MSRWAKPRVGAGGTKHRVQFGGLNSPGTFPPQNRPAVPLYTSAVCAFYGKLTRCRLCQ